MSLCEALLAAITYAPFSHARFPPQSQQLGLEQESFKFSPVEKSVVPSANERMRRTLTLLLF